MKRVFFIAYLLLLTGCGGSRNDSDPAPLQSFSIDAYRPNFGHDLVSANYWPSKVVTYSFPDPGSATSIRNAPLDTLSMGAQEKEDVRGGFAKWGKVLEGKTTFVEVEGRADIEISMQSKGDFGTDLYGLCQTYRLDSQKGIIGRAVITFRSDLSERRTRHVLLHEIGHALGLNGHDSKLSSTMSAISPYFIGPIELTTRDVNTLAATYMRN